MKNVSCSKLLVQLMNPVGNISTNNNRIVFLDILKYHKHFVVSFRQMVQLGVKLN